ncbi:ABC transporter permease [Enterobacter chuandaensis]|uniref:ABC transporter permease n=1 Tax=Enterobacter chuandaensis TaxID=2497875 RepID=UPI00300CBEE8
MSNIINLRNISRSYNIGAEKIEVLKDINLKISKGEMVAIVGASGSGKSTLLNIIGCLDQPDRGDYYLDCKNTSQLSSNQLARLRREYIGFVFQRYHLMPEYKAIENIEIPAIYSGINKKNRRQLTINILRRLGLEGRESSKPGELSGGQQQRVSIARALVNSGQLILADEPTGALDAKSGRDVLTMLHELNQEGHTVIIVTHDINVAKQASRVIEIQDGVIIDDSILKKTASQAEHNILFFKSERNWRRNLLLTTEALIMAIKSMNAHRLRTLITISGMIFGVAAVSTMTALGEGAKQQTLNTMSRLGASTITIYPGSGFTANDSRVNTLVPADVEALSRISVIESISPEVDTSANIRTDIGSATGVIKGVNKDFFKTNGISILYGSNFSDDRNASQLAIIDEKICEEIFKNDCHDIVGKNILIGPVPAVVTGIARASDSQNNITVWMPYTTVMNRLTGSGYLNSISIKLSKEASGGTIGEAIDAISQELTQRHNIKDYKLVNNDQLRKSVEKTGQTFNLLIISLASISLLTGCLSVMNVMLVSVSERIHEIGIRMAIGARRCDIMLLIITEALLLCLLGGVIGMIFSYFSAELISLLLGKVFSPVFSLNTTITAFTITTVIGLISGYIPARKAANLNPVEALRGE